MMDAKYLLGGMAPSNRAQRPTLDEHIGRASIRWFRRTNEYSVFVVDEGAHANYLENGDIAVWIQGYATASVGDSESDVCSYVLDHYQRHESIPYETLDGSFVVGINDSRNERILIYRNIAGSVDIFYLRDEFGVLYTANLAHLIRSSGLGASIEFDMLPTFFLYRCVPGRQTLFRGIKRLLPGDLLRIEKTEIEHRSAQSFADLRSHPPSKADVVGLVNQALNDAVNDCVESSQTSAVLLSGGVDSSLLQCHWNKAIGDRQEAKSYCITIDHPMGAIEYEYAVTAANYLNTELVTVPADRPYIDYLDDVVRHTAETPNHVQAAYFPSLAEVMRRDGTTTGITGEAADGMFGNYTQTEIQMAQLWRQWIPATWLRAVLGKVLFGQRGRRISHQLATANLLNDVSNPFHPINQEAAFTHMDSVVACFGMDSVMGAMERRRNLVKRCGFTRSCLEQAHAAGMLTDGISTVTFWNTMFETKGARLLSPFLDSRVIKLVMSLEEQSRFPFRKPKEVLKQALAVMANRELAYREKQGFGQPIFEWLGVGGQLRPMVDEIDSYHFVKPDVLEKAKQNPNWFLYSLLCFDRLYKHFVRGKPNSDSVTAVAGKSTIKLS